MHCLYCQFTETRVTDTRTIADGLQIRRRRECLRCGKRVTTYETIDLGMPRVIKRDGAIEEFSKQKLRQSVIVPLHKRPVSGDNIEAMLERLLQKFTSLGMREIQSRVIGEMVMRELNAIDKVALLRFASVYLKFNDIADFGRDLEEIVK